MLKRYIPRLAPRLPSSLTQQSTRPAVSREIYKTSPLLGATFTTTARKNTGKATVMEQRFKPTTDAPIVRLMVLETDLPHPDTQSEKGSFGEIVHHHFSTAGKEHHPPLGVETDQIFVVTEQGGRMPKYRDFEGFDGLLITGSMYDAHGNNQWILDLLHLLEGKSDARHCVGASLMLGRTMDQEAQLLLHGCVFRPSAPRPSAGCKGW